MDMIDIAIAKAFATKVAAGFSNVEVDGMTINFTLNDGQTVSLTVPTPADGVSVTDIDIDANGDLICAMSDGTEINAGRVLPQKGVDYWTEEDKQEILDETNEKYDELLDQIPKGNKINKTIYINDSSNLELADGKILGETSQVTTTGKNLFNKNGVVLKSGYYINDVGEEVNSSSWGYISSLIEVLPSTIYTLSGTFISGSSTSYICYYDNNKQWLSNSSSFKPSAGGPPYTFTTPDNCYYITWRYATNVYNGDTIQLELGSTATSYEPYTGGVTSPNPDYPQPVSVVTGNNTINVVGKNLFNIFNYTPSSQGVTRTVNEDGTITINGTATSKNVNFTGINTLYLKAGTYIASIISSSEERVQIFIKRMIDGNVYLNIGGDTGTTEVTFTIHTDQYAQVCLYNDRYAANTHNFDLTFKFQLEYGETATAYEPYQEQTQLISLGDIELCKIRDYQDRIYKENGKWWLEKNVQKVTLDGTEADWSNYSRNNDSALAYTGVYAPSNVLPTKSYDADTNPLVASNKFKRSSYNELYNRIIINGIVRFWGLSTQGKNQNIYIAVDRNALSSYNLTGFKSWLATNTPILYYVSTPTTTEITNTTLINQLENWLKKKTYKNITNIFTVTTNEAPILDITYRKDLETLFNNISQE